VKRLVEFYVTEHNQRIPTPRSKARRRTRSTSAGALRSPTSSLPGDARRGSGAWNGTARSPALRAPAVRQRRTKTSPHEWYDGFSVKLRRTQLRRGNSGMSGAAAVIRLPAKQPTEDIRRQWDLRAEALYPADGLTLDQAAGQSQVGGAPVGPPQPRGQNFSVAAPPVHPTSQVLVVKSSGPTMRQ
jgi:hypothetical protein